MNPKFYERNADHLRIGEVVRIVAINRATGYMGTQRTRVKAAGDEGVSQLLSFYIPKIIMRPPNLKVWAKRSSDVGVESRGEDGIQAIGNEGAALSDDKSIIISTEWLDIDGSPLPAALDDYGFTGRLARVSAPNTLSAKQGAAGRNNSLSNFSIKPGRQTQVIKLAEENLGTEYLYVHVSGEPQKRRSDLSTGSTEGFSGDFNSDPSIYPEGSILKYRPSKFVPLKVSVFDEKSTQKSLDAWKIARQSNPALEKPEPHYRWLYRPEFQVSVYDLELDKIIRTPEQGEPIDIYVSSDPAISASDDTLKLLYNLAESAFDALDAYSYTDDRELVFNLAGQEIRATIGNNQEITFDNLDYIASLQAEDLLTLTLYSNNDAANVLWEYDFKPITINIAADFNRDGKIVFPEDDKLNDKDGKRTDLVTTEKPYVFWVNDDADDKGSEVKGIDITVSGSSVFGVFGDDPNHDNDFIDGSRDLIDFFAVAVDIHDLMNRGDNYTLALRHKENAVNVAFTVMDISNSDAYLDELKIDKLEPIFGGSQTATSLHTIPMRHIQSADNHPGNIIPGWFTKLVKENKNKGVILVEITKATKAPLELVVFKGGEEVMSKPLPLRTLTIEELYLQASLRENEAELFSNKWGETPKAPNISAISSNWSGDKATLKNKDSDTVNSNNNFILMHGYSVDLKSGRAFMNETYKRLYHSGSNALFTGIHWTGNDSNFISTVLQSYWRNNKGAFNTADDLSAFVNTIGGKKTIAAHSMGNVVMGAAISDFGLIADNYFMLNPAVPLEAYDALQLNEEEMMHPDWEKFYFGSELEGGKPADYKDSNGRRLWSTEWHGLFKDTDERNKMTWRGRFSKLTNNNSPINIVQYFSGGEEVLEAAKKGLSVINSPLGRGAWNTSEKAKGNRNIGTAFSGDSRAGWDFRKLNSFSTECILHPLTDCNSGSFTTFEEAKAIPEDEQRIKPFFRHFVDTGILDPTTGSARAKTGHPHLLSYDIPALSFAAGGTELSAEDIFRDNKVDMNSAVFKINGFPAERKENNWFHSDFKDVAYLYTFNLFNDMVLRGGLK